MEQDESRDVDLRRKSPEQRKRNDLRSKISSTVVKIKTEKAEDERRKRAEDRRLRYVCVWKFPSICLQFFVKLINFCISQKFREISRNFREIQE